MKSFLRSTGIVALATLASRILGFVREMLFAAYFGANRATDAFFVAWRIPNLLRRLVAEGGLTISFIPIYTEYLVRRNEEDALELAQKTFTILVLVCGILVVLGIIFSPQVVSLFAWGFNDPVSLDLAVRLNRILFPYLFFVALVAFAMGILNSHGHFFSPAFSPVMLNIWMIAGILVFTRWFSEPLYGVAAGVIAGGIFQLAMQVPYLVRSGFKLRMSLDFRHEGIRRIFRLLGPATFGIAVYQINILMSTMLASQLPSGSISYLYYSDRLTEIVLGIFIISIGNVILPEMSRTTASDDLEGMKKIYTTSLGAALFMAFPSALGLMTAGTPILSVLFMRGSFSYNDALLTERALFFASMGIVSVSILRITAPAFYSLKDTRTPVIAATGAFVVNIGLGYILMNTSLRHAGLSLANTVAVTGQVVFLLLRLRHRVGGLLNRMFFIDLLRMTTASLVMGLAVVFIAGMFDWQADTLLKRIGGLSLIMFSAMGIYFLAAGILGISQVSFIADRIKKKMAGD